MICHNLKIQYIFAKDIACGLKSFEIRFNDRDYNINDFICFTVIDIPNEDAYCIKEYMANHFYKIIYITDFEQKEGYVILGLKEYHI